MSTYGDILNLASEVGDPSLVYRFTCPFGINSAIWFQQVSIRQIRSISSPDPLDRKETADGYLAQLQNPKLFHSPINTSCMFDPNPNECR